MRADNYRTASSPLVLWPKFLHTPQGELAAFHLTTLLEDVRSLLAAQAKDSRAATGEPAAEGPPPAPPPPHATPSGPRRPGRPAHRNESES
jgi:hypothetical protein